MEKSIKASLVLENGRIFKGFAFGYLKEAIGELSFTTQCAGYQEIISDPARSGRLVMFTYPLVGNSGINLDDMEAKTPGVRGVIVRERCAMPNNWRCELDLDGFLKQHKIIGVEGIDTRAVMRIMRNEGQMKGIITTRGDDLTKAQIAQNFESFTTKNIRKTQGTKEIYTLGEGNIKIAVIDLGIANSMLKELAKRAAVTVFPMASEAGEVLAIQPDAVFISSGPGAPSDYPEIIELVSAIAGRSALCGVGLGYLLILSAFGAKLSRMKLGRHGSNSPVKSASDGTLLITEQDNDYFVDELPECMRALYTGVNDDNVEATAHKSLKISGTVFTPPAALLDKMLKGELSHA